MLTISTNLPEFTARMARVPAAMVASEGRAVAKCAKIVEKRVRQHFVAWSPVRGASLSYVGLVRKRTSHLLNSTNSSDAIKDAGGYYATVGFRKGVVDAYAKTVEKGDTFTPSKKLLSIPVGEALTPAGVARYRSPLDVTDGFWRQSMSGLVGFYRMVGKRLELLFVGKTKVVVKPFAPLQRSLDGTRSQSPGIIAAEAAAAIRDALGGR